MEINRCLAIALALFYLVNPARPTAVEVTSPDGIGPDGEPGRAAYGGVDHRLAGRWRYLARFSRR